MISKKQVSFVVGKIFHPPPQISAPDNGLRFTDILFGFVLKELFVRLGNWQELWWGARFHLVAVSALVLSSWIGFRRSANRSQYELKFINLPLVRFLVDQCMLVVYFWLAVRTPQSPKPPTEALFDQTRYGIMVVFALYFVWDVLGIWMNLAGRWRGKAALYPKINQDGTAVPALVDAKGFSITVVATALAGLLWWWPMANPGEQGDFRLTIATAIIVAYRVAKEARTSLKDHKPPSAA